MARTRRWDGHDKTYGRTTVSLRRVASAGFAVYQFEHTELTSQYRLEVAQGVDIALLAAIAICLDEQEKATRSSGWVPTYEMQCVWER